jgi:hypothetical protein
MTGSQTGTSLLDSTTADRISILMPESLRSFGTKIEEFTGRENYNTVYASPDDIYNFVAKLNFDILILPASLQRTSGHNLLDEIVHILPKACALYVINEKNHKKPEGVDATKVRAFIENPPSAQTTAADIATFLEERRTSAEKRRWDRRPLTMDVILKSPQGTFETTALNLSLGGFFVAFPKEKNMPSIGSLVEFEFCIPGIPVLAGKGIVQWTQEVPLNKFAPQARGIGCEFFELDTQVAETICKLVTALSSKKVPPEFVSKVSLSAIANKSIRNLKWLGSHSITPRPTLLESTRECRCFEPLLTLNLTGFLLGFCDNLQGKVNEVFLDLTGPEHSAEFRAEVNGPAVTPETHRSLSTSMPALFDAAGGKDLMFIHHINLDFSLKSDTLAVVFRFPTRGP